jgi:hypothetical protein
MVTQRSSRRHSKKLPIADERLVRNAGIGYAQYCECQHDDVRQLPQPEPCYARLGQGTRRIMCLFRFAHRQFPILYREGAPVVRWMHGHMFRACVACVVRFKTRSLVLLPAVQKMLTSTATGLGLLVLLALGTFVAGVHVSWQICVLGLIMALCVPAIAWLTESALFLVLSGAALIGIGTTFWWRPSEGQTSKLPERGESLD